MKRWCCQGCGTSYPIKPTVCGKCDVAVTGYPLPGSSQFVEVKEAQSAVEIVAQAMIDGRVRFTADYGWETYRANPFTEFNFTMIIEPKVEAGA